MLKYNQAIDQTSKINDTFYNEVFTDFYDKNNLYDLYRMEAALNYRRTTDFRTMAEAVRIDDIFGTLYNWQTAKIRNRKQIINLN